MAAGNLLVTSSHFGQEGLGSIKDATKDPRSSCGARAHKIRGFKNHVVGR